MCNSVDISIFRMLEEILDTRVMVKKSMKEHKSDKVSRAFFNLYPCFIRLSNWLEMKIPDFYENFHFSRF